MQKGICYTIMVLINSYTIAWVSRNANITERKRFTESARTSSSCWTKSCTKIIYTLLQAFVLLLQISSLRVDVSISFASRGKGRLRNAVPNRVPVSRCFSRIREPRSDWFLNSRHC